MRESHVTTNSLGQPICRHLAGLLRFWSSFDGSKIVDEAGRPLVAFHGTGEVFETFDAARLTTTLRTNRLGHFFTLDREKAARYAAYKGGDRVLECYLALVDPLIIDFDRLQRAVGNYRAYQALADEVNSRGAIVYRAGVMSEIIAPLATQIKSIHNRGTWSIHDPNIYA